jgi:hypothetical protein
MTLASQGIGYVGNAVNNPLNPTNLPALTGSLNPNDGVAASRRNYQRDDGKRMQPQIDRDRAALDTRLANQGITHGSEAYGTCLRHV